MSTKARKRKAASPRNQSAGLRRDVQEAIDRIWPDGIVELSFDSDESYFCEISPKLSRVFHRIRNARLIQEREADGGPIWWDQSDPEEDPPDEIEHSRSYHLFFVSLEGKAFTVETEAEGFEEPELMTDEFEEAGWGADLRPCRVPGTGRTGWVVACLCSRLSRSSNSRRRLSPMERPPTVSRSTWKNISGNPAVLGHIRHS
jgi:hypothetical protein